MFEDLTIGRIVRHWIRSLFTVGVLASNPINDSRAHSSLNFAMLDDDLLS